MQPLLHELVSCVRAPGLALSGADGQVRPGGVQGFFRSDVRTLSRLEVLVDGEEPEPLRGQSVRGSQARFVAVSRLPAVPGPDPEVVVERRRSVGPSGVEERLRVSSFALGHLVTTVEVRAACDLCPMDRIRAGDLTSALPAEPSVDGLVWRRADLVAELRAVPAPHRVEGTGTLSWQVELAPGDTWEVVLTSRSEDGDRAAAAFWPARDPVWVRPVVRCADPALPRLVEQGLDDLAGLLLRDGADHFLAAGSPWFFTLFGRDSLWAARMLLPLGTDLALGTLRTLARRQGTLTDTETEEEPGKILHEVRREDLVVGDLSLPPVYYGTVDATPLWVSTLAEAWRWGADADSVRALLPAATRALRWMVDRAAGNGFLTYTGSPGGLVHQGWKDSSDAIQFADGTLAQGRIALSEVQGYAYEAALAGADVLEAHGVGGTDEWRSWGAALRERFRRQFWVQDGHGPYPAVGLDGTGRPVDSVASNMGHLLGTGLLDEAEASLVAVRLGRPDMDSGWGLRTLSSRSRGFAPLSYHGGTVWPHDTAIAVLGLAREGHHATAAALVAGLLRAAPAFDARLPELFAGEQRVPGELPLPYPASCRPQAWAAASGVALLSALTGLRADVPAGRVELAPMTSSPVGPLAVRGLVVDGVPLDIEVDGSGGGTVRGLPAHLVLGSDAPARRAAQGR